MAELFWERWCLMAAWKVRNRRGWCKRMTHKGVLTTAIVEKKKLQGSNLALFAIYFWTWEVNSFPVLHLPLLDQGKKGAEESCEGIGGEIVQGPGQKAQEEWHGLVLSGSSPADSLICFCFAPLRYLWSVDIILLLFTDIYVLLRTSWRACCRDSNEFCTYLAKTFAMWYARLLSRCHAWATSHHLWLEDASHLRERTQRSAGGLWNVWDVGCVECMLKCFECRACKLDLCSIRSSLSRVSVKSAGNRWDSRIELPKDLVSSFQPHTSEGKLRWVYWKLWISRNWQQKLQPQNLKPRQLELERQRRPRSQSDSSTEATFFRMCVRWPQIQSFKSLHPCDLILIFRLNKICSKSLHPEVKRRRGLVCEVNWLVTSRCTDGDMGPPDLSDHGCESCRPCVGEKPTLEVGQELTMRVVRRTRNSLRLDYKGKEAREWTARTPCSG